MWCHGSHGLDAIVVSSVGRESQNATLMCILDKHCPGLVAASPLLASPCRCFAICRMSLICSSFQFGVVALHCCLIGFTPFSVVCWRVLVCVSHGFNCLVLTLLSHAARFSLVEQA